jgi:hypothetical protein
VVNGIATRLAALALLASAALTLGCSAEQPPPATIREYQEPTDTVSQLIEEPQDSTDTPGGPLPSDLRNRLEADVELLGVSYAADGAYLMVGFLASPRLAILWQPGELYIVDETTGTKYSQIPFMPKIGRLIGRPAQEGQPGYVMLQNVPPISPGTKVTVVLGGFRQKRVSVEASNAPLPVAP